MVGLRFSKDNSNSDFTSISSVVSSFIVLGVTLSWLSSLFSDLLDLILFKMTSGVILNRMVIYADSKKNKIIPNPVFPINN